MKLFGIFINRIRMIPTSSKNDDKMLAFTTYIWSFNSNVKKIHTSTSIDKAKITLAKIN